MPKQMSEKNFSNLLDYYIACLEQEDMLSVTFNVSSENIEFLSTLFQTEVLFHTNNKQVTIKNSEGIKKFFQTSLLRQKNKTLFYGYPVVMTPEGTVSPLFFIELQYEQKDTLLLLHNQTAQYRLNHHILSQHQFSAEEIKNIQQEIETEDFSSTLESICKLLHFKSTDCTATLDEKPFKRTHTPKLLNKVILYFGERTEITRNLIAELSQLKKKPFDELASTALLLVLNGEYHSENFKPDTTILLEVFSLNATQKNAVQRSLHQSLTVITGPPGTGKSQVVLNLIANAVFQNKTVLFASKNNKAVDVVIEKINAILPLKFIVRMGHQRHRRNAKTDLEQLMTQPLKMHTVKEKFPHELLTTASHIERIHHQILTLITLNESLEIKQTDLDFLHEQHPSDQLLQKQPQRLERVDPFLLQEDLLKFFGEHFFLKHLNPKRYQRKQERCFRKYYELLPALHKSSLQISLTNGTVTRETALQRILLWKKEEIILDEMTTIQQAILALPPYDELKNKLAACHQQYINISQSVLQHHWVNRFAQASEEDKQHIKTYFSASEQLESKTEDKLVYRKLQIQRVRALQRILKFLPAWVVTNLSAKQSFPLKNAIFDFLIIDEASQCDIASALPLFYRAKQIVIIGDPHQLKHISLLSESQDKTLATTHQVPKELHINLAYTTHSLYDFAAQVIRPQNHHPILLNEHYRCHPDIVSFSNEYYYGRKLIIATDETRLIHHPLFQTRILWHHVKGKTIHSKSPYNEQEAERVVEELLKILEVVSSIHASLGIVTLFRAQAELIAEKLKKFQEVFESDITIGTAHRFQGDEKDIVVFSPAVSEDVKPGTLHWIQTTSQLLNVAVTRARSMFLIVGDQEICGHASGPLKNLYEYVQAKETKIPAVHSPTQKIFYSETKKHHIPIAPYYSTNRNTPYQVDFALFANGKRYALEIGDTQGKNNHQQLQSEGWKIRKFSEKDITDNLTEVIEQLKRLC
jgi:GTPase SAR1 family protein